MSLLSVPETLDEADSPDGDSEVSDEDRSDDSDVSDEDLSDYSADEKVEGEVTLGEGDDEAGLVQDNATQRALVSPSVVQNGTGEMNRKQSVADMPEASSHIYARAAFPVGASGEKLESAEQDRFKKDAQKFGNSTSFAECRSQRGRPRAFEDVAVEPLLQRSQEIVSRLSLLPMGFEGCHMMARTYSSAGMSRVRMSVPSWTKNVR